VDADVPAGWLFLSPEALPDVWRSRAQPAVFVPLMPAEARQLLAGEAAEPTLSARDEKVARLAARGRTADAIARELGISRRTVDRRLALLREQFGVSSSVELGVCLSALGLALSSAAPAGVAGTATAPTNPVRNGAFPA
jgi:DNA-binding CsgD family transcriptional regulator